VVRGGTAFGKSLLVLSLHQFCHRANWLCLYKWTSFWVVDGESWFVACGWWFVKEVWCKLGLFVQVGMISGYELRVASCEYILGPRSESGVFASLEFI
jgi:hypothetical protein